MKGQLPHNLVLMHDRNGKLLPVNFPEDPKRASHNHIELVAFVSFFHNLRAFREPVRSKPFRDGFEGLKVEFGEVCDSEHQMQGELLDIGVTPLKTRLLCNKFDLILI